jgi:hypothetical protein
VKKRKRAAAAPPSLAALYREITGDTDAHQGTIAAHFRALEPRRQRIITRRLRGETFAYIGECFGVTAAAAQSSVKLSMRAIGKAIAGQPRYHLAGRPHGYTRRDHRAGDAAAARQQAAVARSQK